MKTDQKDKQATVTIYLSSRGWGEKSPVEWTGNIYRSDDEIIAECLENLENAYDVDEMLTAAQITKEIGLARKNLQSSQQAKMEGQQRIDDLQAAAQKSGQPQVIRSWMTVECMNGSIDCSFDSAVETIDGQGNRKTTYTCCY